MPTGIGVHQQLADFAAGASRGTLRTDADDRTGWLAVLSGEQRQHLAVAGIAESTESPAGSIVPMAGSIELPCCFTDQGSDLCLSFFFGETHISQ